MTAYTLWDTRLGDVSAKTILQTLLAVGNSWFVDAATGNDATGDGSSTAPFASLTAALAAATANNGDTVYLQGTVHVTSTVNWNKNNVNLVGINAPSNNSRARISSTGATAFSPLVNVTSNGCSFVGVGTFHGGFTGATGSQVCWNEAGGRNYYSFVEFLGGGDATTAALAGMRSLTITGEGENVFEDCTVGLDTIVRATAANASLEMLGGTARNVMRRTVFQAYCTDTGDTHVLIQANGMDRYLLLDNCTFHNFGGTSLTAAISNAGGSPAGDVILTPNCISVGASAIAASGAVYVGQISAAGGATTGIGVLAT
jgi:hypothetical protein